MQLEPGMRVRCVDAGLNHGIVTGSEYVVAWATEREVFVMGDRIPYHRERFRPVVRVKAPLVYTGKAFDNRDARAVEMFGRLPPEIQAAHRDEQRRSWVHGELALRKMELS